MKYSRQSETLQDLNSKGKPRPWRERKISSLKVAGCFERRGDLKRAERIRSCACLLEFIQQILAGTAESAEIIKYILKKAYFCKERLCSMCNWRRSLRMGYVLSTVLDEVGQRNKNFIPLFLTLTVRNCPADVEELTATLDKVIEGWHRLFRNNRKIGSAVKGWFRSLELTYNEKTVEFHPHIHAILLVDRRYFKGKEYIKHPEWRRLWRSALRIDYDPQCRIQTVKNKKDERRDILEVTKDFFKVGKNKDDSGLHAVEEYSVKEMEFLTDDDNVNDYLIAVLSKSLRGRRLYAFGGIMKQVASELKILDKEGKENLIQIGDTIREDIAQLLVKFLWRLNISDYTKVRTRDDRRCNAQSPK